MMQSRSERNIKKRRELLAAYVPTDSGLWRRAHPETFYEPDSLVDHRKLEFISAMYDIFRAAIDGHRRTLIEDEINLMYMDIEIRVASGRFSEEILTVIQQRLRLKKPAIQKIQVVALDIESRLPDLSQNPPNLRFRFENTVYLVRVLAYGLFSGNDIILERVAEVFDVAKLQAATTPRARESMDNALKFLYKGLIQRNDRGRQGSRHAARQALGSLREWFSDNEYVAMCIDGIGKYV